jgi:hypothetical protein
MRLIGRSERSPLPLRGCFPAPGRPRPRVPPCDADLLPLQREVGVVSHRLPDSIVDPAWLEVVGESDAHRGRPTVVGRSIPLAPQREAVSLIVGLGLALQEPPFGVGDRGAHDPIRRPLHSRRLCLDGRARGQEAQDCHHRKQSQNPRLQPQHPPPDAYDAITDIMHDPLTKLDIAVR